MGAGVLFVGREREKDGGVGSCTLVGVETVMVVALGVGAQNGMRIEMIARKEDVCGGIILRSMRWKVDELDLRTGCG